MHLEPPIIHPLFISCDSHTNSDSDPLTFKRGNNDKRALQVYIRDLIGFGLSGLQALPDCQAWARVCVFCHVGEFAGAGGTKRGREREILCESPSLPCVIANAYVCLHKKYFICCSCEQRHSLSLPRFSPCTTITFSFLPVACVSRMWLARRCVFLLHACSRVCVFVRVGPRAQHRSRSLWSLRGSFPPAPPPVSVLLGTPRATMTAQPSRFAHQAHQIGSLRPKNLAPISYPHWIPSLLFS